MGGGSWNETIPIHVLTSTCTIYAPIGLISEPLILHQVMEEVDVASSIYMHAWLLETVGPLKTMRYGVSESDFHCCTKALLTPQTFIPGTLWIT